MVILVVVYDAVVMGVLGNAVVGGGKDDMVLKVVVMDLSQIYVLRDLVASMLIEGTSKAVERWMASGWRDSSLAVEWFLTGGATEFTHPIPPEENPPSQPYLSLPLPRLRTRPPRHIARPTATPARLPRRRARLPLYHACTAYPTIADEPRDARVVRGLLRSLGLHEREYEPRVVHQFIDLAYRYIDDVLRDAQVYADHAGKAQLDVDDVRLAI
ncbi:hypothetical protein GUJ93_ZPchr0008g13931 [Zizania palustris]|uniref:Transcription initiation factor TFIID subunit 9 n=1 Tax=Zizania palustris TaxID=103762 RepID=A0A8J5VKN7_ZIZPA|nr:hypothetical protein GUJ93_ZPchr0008g13931 [Zizania palustris]